MAQRALESKNNPGHVYLLAYMIQFKNLYEVKCVDGNLQIKISQLL